MTIAIETRSGNPRRWGLLALAGAVILALAVWAVVNQWGLAENTGARAGSTVAPMTSGEATLVKDQILDRASSSSVATRNGEVILFKDTLQPAQTKSEDRSTAFAVKDRIEAGTG